ncbi:MAG TPA: 3-deoxy-7-phosphoheptulonate synthase class II [Candidatus Hydrogenedentes bacterium]|jgi:3-deoxy-7-phosphoheptulonate synthase|nr:MAG: Phospho-2-dehydro-3-deoxyheptonate aldolase [Candidatus Hydrogenedentes bacterium ADurb.Bin170]HNZ47280.1 3-deoxy-7-phosphoheptulonate synthase class II [Candidatus Hydrogenedentota bacterium]HOD95667.1 3-deoxy-7-phosphoheptulonate synthase class II [Candidatus Hydrogenedentota bacterium]HOM47532.1 3-deoxy-7-phosphoheptulonate synthase class II [Candidatus Hydrogenedentota bacterium]HOR50640.1 3-deoxy-7-phosphoheptulonate synthase class II [Candidatus Hydrogenedentota bacterium]
MHIESSKKKWHPYSWQEKPALQQPSYGDKTQVAEVLEILHAKPPLVSRGEIDRLLNELAEAAAGKRFLLHGGDCAERFSDCSAEALRRKLEVLLQMSLVLTYATRRPVIRIGRLAGQYAKPRSADEEIIDGRSLPVYRGDLINDFSPDEKARKADPCRMIEGYHHAAASLNYLRALIEGGFADLHHPEKWGAHFLHQCADNQDYRRILDAIADAVRFMDMLGGDAADRLKRIAFYTSHEALLLPYDAALTRQENEEHFYNLGAHYLWLGYRTSQLKGAHVEYLRGISNPVGIKVGAASDTEELVSLLQCLNPAHVPGRITVITRFGAGKVKALLPPLINAIRKAHLPVLWCCDPMHGNTESLADGRKTRHVHNIFSELEESFAVHASLDSCLGGVHFEQTGEEVTECLGGNVTQHDLEAHYETACDPRLNGAQALEMAFLIARLLR